MRSARKYKKSKAQVEREAQSEALEQLQAKIAEHKEQRTKNLEKIEYYPKRLARVPEELSQVALALDDIREAAENLETILKFLSLRSSLWLLNNRFKPGEGSFQERLERVRQYGIEVEIPDEFKCKLSEGLINAPIKVTGEEKGECTFIDFSSYEKLPKAEVNPDGYKRVYGQPAGQNGRKYRCNPFTGEAFIEEPEVDEGCLAKIKCFVEIHEIQVYLEVEEERRQQALASIWATAKNIEKNIPILHQHPNEMVTDPDIPLHVKTLPRHFRSNLFAKSLMTFPVLIDKQWSVDFYDLMTVLKKSPSDSEQTKPLTLEQSAKLEEAKQNRRHYQLSTITRHRKQFEIFSKQLDADKNPGHQKLRLSELLDKYKGLLNKLDKGYSKEVKRASKLSYAGMTELLREKYISLLKQQEENYTAAMQQIEALTYADICERPSVSHCNPLRKHHKPIESFIICYDVLKELDHSLECALLKSMPGFEEQCDSIFELRTLLLKQQENLRKKNKSIPFKIAHLKRKNEELTEKIEALLKLEQELTLNLSITEVECEIERVHKAAHLRFDFTIMRHKDTTFMQVLAAHKYPIKMIPDTLPIEVTPATNQIRIMTHPVILDNMHVIDFDELKKFWQPESSWFGFGYWSTPSQPGINPFTGKKIESIHYASDLRIETEVFIKNIKIFKEMIAPLNKKGDCFEGYAQCVEKLQIMLCEKLKLLIAEDAQTRELATGLFSFQSRLTYGLGGLFINNSELDSGLNSTPDLSKKY